MILVISSKNSYAAKRLAEEGGENVVIMSVGDLVDVGFNVDPNKFDVLYIRDPYLNSSPEFLPKIIELAKSFKAAGKRVVDANIAEGKIGLGKAFDYQHLEKATLPIPKTEFLSDHLFTNFYPLVLKWNYGFGSKNVFLIANELELKEIVRIHPDKEWLVQEYINAQWELEVYVIGFKAVPQILCYEIKNGFKANVKKYSIIKNQQGHPGYSQLLALAERTAQVLGRELCKIDILDSCGHFFILEGNRNPGLVSFETLIGYNIAREFIKYLSLTNQHMKVVLSEKPEIEVPQQPTVPNEPVSPQA